MYFILMTTMFLVNGDNPHRTFRSILANSASSTMARRCEFLKRCPFLEPLTPQELSKLAGALEVSYYEPGDYIVRQGDEGNSFYIIEEGNVKCTQVKSCGKEYELMYVYLKSKM
jgi:CRP-like cAMP-binding protein